MADDASNTADSTQSPGTAQDAATDQGTQDAGGQDSAKPTLEASLASLDDATRAFVLGEVHKARNEAQGLRARLKDAEPKVQAYDALEEAGRTEAERWQATAIENQRQIDAMRARAVQAEIRAASADKFADPSDATAFLTGDYTTDDGGIDTQRIAADINDLLANKPHLRKQRGPAFDRAQGASSQGQASPGQLSQSDIDRLYKERRYDEIEQARQSGRLDHLLGVTR